MQQYEDEHKKKGDLIQTLETDQTQLIYENNAMSEQLFKLKSDVISGDKENISSGANYKETIQQDKMIELLKRNHDVMVEKYEIYRQRNEGLEKTNLEKESLYVQIKAENDKLADALYNVKRQAEELS